MQQALKCIVDELKKLTPRHIRYEGSDPVPIMDSSIQRVLDDPNPLMTTSEFIEKTAWMLLLNYNAFILPVYYVWIDKKTGEQRRKYEALFPIKPTEVDFIEDPSGRLGVTFYFGDGTQSTVAYEDVIHLKYNYSINPYMGGNFYGEPDNRALIKTLELNEKLLKGVAKAMDASYAVNGIVKYNTMLDNGKMEKALQELEDKLRKSESGFLPLDIKGEFMPFSRAAALVDEPTLKFIDSKILRNFGVPLNILTGEYSSEDYAAFYQKTLEPIIISMGQAFTKKLFTPREKSFGNQVKFYPKELVFLSMSQKLEMVRELAPTGAIMENEKRTAFGMPPLPELEGKRYMSLNWIDANNAQQYQVGEVDVVDELKEDI